MSDVVSVPKKEDVEEEEEDEDLNVPTWHETEKCEDERYDLARRKGFVERFHHERFVRFNQNITERDDLPKREDENEWYLFCFEGEGHAPLLSIVKSMDTMTRETVLSYHVDWLDEKADFLDTQFAVWIYALLVGIDKPLSPSAASDIRSLLVKCCKMRSECNAKKKHENSLACLNIMITLAGTYFGQEEPDRRVI